MNNNGLPTVNYLNLTAASSIDVYKRQHQQDADLAATGQERICIREEQHREEDKLQPLYEAIVAGKLNLRLKSPGKPLRKE